MALEAENDITENLVWGDETVRLTPPASFVQTLVASGKPPIIPDVIAPPPLDATEPPPVSYLRYLDEHIF